MGEQIPEEPEYHDLLLSLAFPGQEVSVVNIEENIEINLPTRPVDMVMANWVVEGKKAAKESITRHYTSNSILPISQPYHKPSSSTLRNLLIA
jgi:hypothetical protein